jgi:uncharacterized protein YkwD
MTRKPPSMLVSFRAAMPVAVGLSACASGCSSSEGANAGAPWRVDAQALPDAGLVAASLDAALATVDAAGPSADAWAANTDATFGGDAGVAPTNDSGYGVPSAGYPTWNERTLVVLTNAVRIAPRDWYTKYLQPAYSTAVANVAVLAATTYPAVPPLRYDVRLGESSRAQSNDLANTPGCAFQHNSCDGGSPSTRISSYFGIPNVPFGENIAAGDSTAMGVINLWLCDAATYDGPCSPDGNGDGHRSNIMQASFGLVGTGYATGTNQYTYYWTQDFVSRQNPPPPLVDGSHLFPNSGYIDFYANYVGTAPPTAVSVFIDGAENAMSLDLGTALSGTYRVELSTASACREYYFTATDGSSTTWRYPSAGSFATAGEGTCMQDYVP